MSTSGHAIAHFLADLCLNFPGLGDLSGVDPVDAQEFLEAMRDNVRLYKEGPFWPVEA